MGISAQDIASIKIKIKNRMSNLKITTCSKSDIITLEKFFSSESSFLHTKHLNYALQFFACPKKISTLLKQFVIIFKCLNVNHMVAIWTKYNPRH